MKKLTTFALCIFVLTGCGSDPAAPSLRGLWAVGETLGLKVDGNAYELAILGHDDSASGRLGLEVELGTFSATDELIDIVPTQASCPMHDHQPFSLTYKLTDNDHLRLNLPSGVALFERLPDVAAGSASAAYGCLDGGAFTAHVLTGL